MATRAEVGDYVRKDGEIVQVTSIEGTTLYTSDGGCIGEGELGPDDVLLPSEVEGG